MENAVLRAQGLTKRYGSKLALDNLDLTLPEGKIIGLLGPNGSGKTTFIKLAAGLLSPTAGSVTVCGKPIGPDSKAMVSYLPDKTYFNKQQKIRDLLTLFQDFYDDFDRTRAEEMLRELQIDLEAKLKTLSKGNQEKVQLVLVMSRRARLYLLDEPIGGVDPAAGTPLGLHQFSKHLNTSRNSSSRDFPVSSRTWSAVPWRITLPS